MNKLVLCLSLLLPVSAYAQEIVGNISGTFPCFDFEALRKSLRTEHEEIPFVSAEGRTTLLNMTEETFEMAEHDLYLFANPKTYRYTLVFKMDAGENGIGCIVSGGNNLGPVIQDKGI
jgi:hypothetical protein